ncbi:hypothetical protein ACU4GD_07065 [Cupriavidus basilensis]
MADGASRPWTPRRRLPTAGNHATSLETPHPKTRGIAGNPFYAEPGFCVASGGRCWLRVKKSGIPKHANMPIKRNQTTVSRSRRCGQ